VLVGILLGVAFSLGWAAFFTLRAYWLCLAILFLMGAVDDWRPLQPGTKLVVQVVAATLFILLTRPDVWSAFLPPMIGWLAFPVLLVWIVGMTNALNLLDNMDGVTAGVGGIAAIGFVWLGLGADWVLLPFAGALIGFLLLNFYRAPIYLGDAGSHLVGFSLAVLPLYGAPRESVWITPLILAIPILDTSFVSITRLLRNSSPFQGGKDHLAHRLAAAGIPQPAVTGSFLVLEVGLVAVAWFFFA